MRGGGEHIQPWRHRYPGGGGRVVENWANRFHRPAPQAEELRGHFIAEPEKRLKQNRVSLSTKGYCCLAVIAWLEYFIQKISSIFHQSAILLPTAV